MNTSFPASYFHPDVQYPDHPDPRGDYHKDSFIADHSNSILPPCVSQLTECLEYSPNHPDHPSLFLVNGLSQNILQEEPIPGLARGDTMSDDSPCERKEEKYLKRRLKNERNHNDLNRSLATLKRAGRNPTSDNSVIFGNDALKAERSYNLEVDHSFSSPYTRFKPVSASTKHSTTGLNRSFNFFSKDCSESQQLSPIKPEKEAPRSHQSPKRTKSPFRLEINNFESINKEVKPVTPKSNFHKVLPNCLEDCLDALKGSDQEDNTCLSPKEENAFVTPWPNNEPETFRDNNNDKIPEIPQKKEWTKKDRPRIIIDDREVTSRENSTNRSRRNKIFSNEKREFPAELAMSLKKVIEMNTDKKVLDTSLPSKAGLSEKQSPRGAYGFGDKHERIASWGGPDIAGKAQEESIMITYSPNMRGQEEGTFTPVERRTVEAWKSELLEIKSDMEKRQKGYQEVDKFFEMLKSEKTNKRNLLKPESRERNRRVSDREAYPKSLFSPSNMSSNSKVGTLDLRPTDVSTTSILTPKSSHKASNPSTNRREQVSFGFKVVQEPVENSRFEAPTQQIKSPGLRIRGKPDLYFDPNANNRSYTQRSEPQDVPNKHESCQLF